MNIAELLHWTMAGLEWERGHNVGNPDPPLTPREYDQRLEEVRELMRVCHHSGLGQRGVRQHFGLKRPYNEEGPL